MQGEPADGGNSLEETRKYLLEFKKELLVSEANRLNRFGGFCTNCKEKWIARAKARYAITKGIIKKPKKCEVCEQVKPLQGHHEDYSKPLEVIFLCYTCHAEADRILESNLNKF